ncbi:unnamed protein product [Danaus chrysippus]|uniref:XK-related protein n=1 Tax=Danaus chrysippus TaxID=151541 RepID=A0A8J2W541_9NEOP|nr:unnamed protein product [Danaus chrysippus]
MPNAVRKMLQKNSYSYDEPDRIPHNISISYIDIFMYVVAIVGHFVDLGLDINVAVRYSLSGKMMEFGWTLAFILIPAFVNTSVSIRMYSQDKQQDSITNEFTKRKWLRIFILVLQMAPILRFIDALIYAIKSRQAQKRNDPSSQRLYYSLMLKEDSDAALLRIFECFLEAAPQHVLQTCLLMQQLQSEHDTHLILHQVLSIISSVIGMGWCLAAYQRAVRFAQKDKENVTWAGSVVQTLWHFLVTLSRVISISIISYLFPHWTILACCVHILIMTTWLQFYDRSPFCSNNKLGELCFSLALGAVYLFTYILPIEGRTRYSFMRTPIYFYTFLLLCVVPYIMGIALMCLYYGFLHPKTRFKDAIVNFKSDTQIVEVS